MLQIKDSRKYDDPNKNGYERCLASLVLHYSHLIYALMSLKHMYNGVGFNKNHDSKHSAESL